MTTTTLDDGTREMLVALHTACTRLVEFIADASDTPVDISLAVDGCLQTTAEGVAQMSDETIADIAIVTGGDVECMAMLAVMASAVASDPTIDRQLVVDHVIAPLWPRCVAIIASGP
ncbi:MAG: hypothetical protein D6683_02440 [Actinomyces sp.]|nr:MAG: hypothetical protein D6683_02440 [Actinomyces sp.]